MRAKGSRLPIVAMNFAMTFDGKISTRNRTPSDFSSKRDKRRLLELRSEADAILVTARTLRADRMTLGLPARDLQAARQARGAPRFPLRVILSNSGRIDPEHPVFETDFAPILIFSTTRMPKRARTSLEGKATLHLSDTGTVSLREMMETLRRSYGAKRLICEGGGTLARSLFAEKLVDIVHLTLCPRVFGGRKAITLTGPAGDYLSESTRCRLAKMEVIGEECFLTYKVLK